MTPSSSPVLHWKGAGSEKSAGLALGPGFSVFVVITVSSLQRLYTSLLCRAQPGPKSDAVGRVLALSVAGDVFCHEGSYPAGFLVIPGLSGLVLFHRVSSDPVE